MLAVNIIIHLICGERQLMLVITIRVTLIKINTVTKKRRYM